MEQRQGWVTSLKPYLRRSAWPPLLSTWLPLCMVQWVYFKWLLSISVFWQLHCLWTHTHTESCGNFCMHVIKQFQLCGAYGHLRNQFPFLWYYINFPYEQLPFLFNSNFIKLHKYYYLFVHHCALLDVFYGESSEITVQKELHELEGTASRILGSILSRFWIWIVLKVFFCKTEKSGLYNLAWT